MGSNSPAGPFLGGGGRLKAPASGGPSSPPGLRADIVSLQQFQWLRYAPPPPALPSVAVRRVPQGGHRAIPHRGGVQGLTESPKPGGWRRGGGMQPSSRLLASPWFLSSPGTRHRGDGSTSAPYSGDSGEGWVSQPIPLFSQLPPLPSFLPSLYAGPCSHTRSRGGVSSRRALVVSPLATRSHPIRRSPSTDGPSPPFPSKRSPVSAQLPSGVCASARKSRFC